MVADIKFITWLLLLPFFMSTVIPAAMASEMPWMPPPGTMVTCTPTFIPSHLRGMVIHQNDPFKFDFLVYRGAQHLTETEKQTEYSKLIKYFLASLAIPDEDQWVNLSPYEKDRIVPDAFGLTEMGRDLLAQDYLLKQISASLTNPDTVLGKKFWDGVYEKAYDKFGTTDIPTDTFNKVWIVPDKAVVYEKGNTVYVLEHHLKVMMESDYKAMKENAIDAPTEEDNEAVKISKQVMREIIIPAIELEVNEGKNFAPLRQVYSGMLLACWYKGALKESILNKLYADKSKVKGIDQDPKNNQAIYGQYVEAFKRGVFSMIKEDIDRYSQEVIPRKYFSGGTMPESFGKIVRRTELDPSNKNDISDASMADDAVTVVLSPSSQPNQQSTNNSPKERFDHVKVSFPDHLSSSKPDWLEISRTHEGAQFLQKMVEGISKYGLNRTKHEIGGFVNEGQLNGIHGAKMQLDSMRLDEWHGLIIHNHPFSLVRTQEDGKWKRWFRSVISHLAPSRSNMQGTYSDIHNPGAILVGAKSLGYFLFEYSPDAELATEYSNLTLAGEAAGLRFLMEKQAGRLFEVKENGTLEATTIEDINIKWQAMLNDPEKMKSFEQEMGLENFPEHPGNVFKNEFAAEASTVIQFLTGKPEGYFQRNDIIEFTSSARTDTPALKQLSLDIGNERESINFFSIDLTKNEQEHIPEVIKILSDANSSLGWEKDFLLLKDKLLVRKGYQCTSVLRMLRQQYSEKPGASQEKNHMQGNHQIDLTEEIDLNTLRNYQWDKGVSLIAYNGISPTSMNQRQATDDFGLTVGTGKYLTTKNMAVNYAKYRASTAGSNDATLRKYSIENVKLLYIPGRVHLQDLEWAKEWIDYIKSKYQDGSTSFVMNTIAQLEAQYSGNANMAIQDLVAHFDELFTEFLTTKGYDGLVTVEGREGRPNSEDDHVTVLVFDRAKPGLISSTAVSDLAQSDSASAVVNVLKKNTGGIDLSASNLNLQIKRDGQGVPLPINQQDLDNIQIDGLVPVILNIKPAANMQFFTESETRAETTA